MSRLRRSLKSPGGPPLTDKRALYTRLMAEGMSSLEACRRVGVNARTGKRWRNGRPVVRTDGSRYVYPAISTRARPEISARFLSEAERLCIADALVRKRSVRSIARELGRAPSTVSRELRRNRDPVRDGCHPFTAQRLAAARRRRPRPLKLDRSDELRRVVTERLLLRWSPEQIVASLRREFPDRGELRIAAESIYQAVYRPGGLKRPVRLRSGRTRRRPRRRGPRRPGRFYGPMLLIGQRPACVLDRREPGHWEGDLTMGKGNRSAIGTLVERTTRYTILLHLPNGHGPAQVNAAIVDALVRFPSVFVRSITWDQGTEMHRHGQLAEKLGVPVYFCEPASPWQRPTNENTNGLLREYFPKRTDLRQHDAERLAEVATELNDRPRKTLGWGTPADRFRRLLTSVT